MYLTKKSNTLYLYNYKQHFLKNLIEFKLNKFDLDFDVKFNNLFLKNGLKLKGLSFVNLSIFSFYSFFFTSNSNEGLKNQDLINFLKTDSNFFQKKFLLSQINDLLSSLFFLKIEKISKKIKKMKKLNKLNYKYKLCYAPKNKRGNMLLKQFVIYVNTLKYFSLTTRLKETFTNLILENKNSILYKQKINLIKKFK